jgi:hypothetical protein
MAYKRITKTILGGDQLTATSVVLLRGFKGHENEIEFGSQMYDFIVKCMHTTLLSGIVSFYSNPIIDICLASDEFVGLLASYYELGPQSYILLL